MLSCDRWPRVRLARPAVLLNSSPRDTHLRPFVQLSHHLDLSSPSCPFSSPLFVAPYPSPSLGLCAAPTPRGASILVCRQSVPKKRFLVPATSIRLSNFLCDHISLLSPSHVAASPHDPKRVRIVCPHRCFVSDHPPPAPLSARHPFLRRFFSSLSSPSSRRSSL